MNPDTELQQLADEYQEITEYYDEELEDKVERLETACRQVISLLKPSGYVEIVGILQKALGL